uniref:Uncharacterized protein n=1 Tax=Megaselia scalaris TaxID=36166 RepID=T1GZT6_MEGSC
MEENGSAKKCFFTKPNRYRMKGRLRTRWSDVISRNARLIGVPNWRTTAKNREVGKAAIIQTVYSDCSEDPLAESS